MARGGFEAACNRQNRGKHAHAYTGTQAGIASVAPTRVLPQAFKSPAEIPMETATQTHTPTFTCRLRAHDRAYSCKTDGDQCRGNRRMQGHDSRTAGDGQLVGVAGGCVAGGGGQGLRGTTRR